MKNNEHDFKVGNVIQDLHGNLSIIYDIDEKLIRWISFDSCNVWGAYPIKGYWMSKRCYCNEHGMEEECEFCHGTGEGKEWNPGIEGLTKLAENVKDYIKARLLKNFEFN